MTTLASLHRRIDALTSRLPPEKCRCPGPVVILMQGEDVPATCPRCGAPNPPALEIIEEIREAE
ncbi:MAG TPA: hypothetical protein VH643_21185 [Gemmataceae bacterium]|jgi:hypothetical protein